LNKQLAIPILGLSIFILMGMTFMTMWKTRGIAESDARSKLAATAKFHAANVRLQIEEAFSISREIASQAESDVKHHQQNREKMIYNLQDYLSSNPRLIGAWMGFEPNAYDGQDANFKNKTWHEGSGLFLPWWARAESKLEYKPLINEATPDLGDWYKVPKARKKETLIEPYVDKVGDKEMMMTSAVVPLIRDSNFAGVAGVDIALNSIQEQVQQIKPYASSSAYIISFKGNYVSAPDIKSLTKKAIFPFSQDQILSSIAKSEELQVEGIDPADGKKYLLIVSPLPLGKTEEPWALVIKTPSSEVLAAVTDLTIFQVVVALVGICAIGTTVFYISSSISKKVADRSGRLEKSAGSVNQSIEQLSVAGQALSESSSSSAAALEQTVASLEEMTAMVKMNSDNAKQAASLSLASSQAAVKGEEEMQNLVSSMHDISKASKKIEEIINVIDDIAFQTNLLALNASVEAARAGEQGRGFAVVAEAVRTLAQRSASAAKDISTLIKDSVEMIEHGTDLADKSGEVLKTIVTSVKKVSDLNTEISAASEEQATGIHQISKAMTDLDQSVQSNAASSEEIASTAEEIKNQSHLMNQVTIDLKNIVKGEKKSA
jgi:methyl-accepting chemotaxis protein